MKENEDPVLMTYHPDTKQRKKEDDENPIFMAKEHFLPQKSSTLKKIRVFLWAHCKDVSVDKKAEKDKNVVINLLISLNPHDFITYKLQCKEKYFSFAR